VFEGAPLFFLSSAYHVSVLVLTATHFESNDPKVVKKNKEQIKM
jgi:hypothetical protein